MVPTCVLLRRMYRGTCSQIQASEQSGSLCSQMVTVWRDGGVSSEEPAESLADWCSSALHRGNQLTKECFWVRGRGVIIQVKWRGSVDTLVSPLKETIQVILKYGQHISLGLSNLPEQHWMTTTHEHVPATFSIWSFICVLLLLCHMSNSWRGNYTSVLGCFSNTCQMLFLHGDITRDSPTHLRTSPLIMMIIMMTASGTKTVKIHDQNVSF